MSNDHGFSKACPSGNIMLNMREPEPKRCRACGGDGVIDNEECPECGGWGRE